MTAPRKLFVAGATGETGKLVWPMAVQAGLDVIPHLRPGTAQKLGAQAPPNAAVLELSDAPALEAALRGCTTVLQLIGTMRSRFARGDTYETSDIGTTHKLCAAAVRAGVDHVVLLSSTGAGRPMGAYLKAKAEAERIVRESGLAWSIFRPSAFEGGGHKGVPGLRAVTSALGLSKWKPIRLEELASALVKCAADRSPVSAVLEGGPLWELVESASALRAGRPGDQH